MKYDTAVDGSGSVEDEFTIGTMSAVRWLGSGASLAEASTKMINPVSAVVRDMLSFNAETDETSSSSVDG